MEVDTRIGNILATPADDKLKSAGNVLLLSENPDQFFVEKVMQDTQFVAGDA